MFFLSIMLMPLTTGVLAQDEKKFSGNALTFVAELKGIVEPKTDADKDFVKQLEVFWVSDTVNAERKDNIIELASRMLPLVKENKSPLMRYMRLVVHFFRDLYALQQYETWNRAANALFKNENFNLIDLIKFLKDSENTVYSSFMNQTNSFVWKSNLHPSYHMQFDQELSVHYRNINLTCISRHDSIFIKNTSGTYYPKSKKWVGDKGKITWIRSEFPENEIFVDINHSYTIDLGKNFYNIDSVMFTHSDYFVTPNMGSVSDKLIKDYTKDNIQYPEFRSYDKWFKIGNLFDKVNYEGGFVMQGSQLIGQGTHDKLATIIVERKGKEFLRAEGKILVFQRSMLNSDKASIKIKIGADSLIHTGLHFNYNNKTRTVTIAPTDKLTTQSPIHSSYHKLSIWFNQMSWNIDTDSIIFSAPTGSSIGTAQFESDDYFNEELFDAMMGLSDRHPLFAIWAYKNKIGSRQFLAADLAVYLRKPMEHVKIEMMRIAKQGYVLYDFASDLVTITDKLDNAIRARHREIDYDVIKFNSRCDDKTPNAILNIDSMNLKIRGIDHIEVSQTQNVHISPLNRTINMGKNRNFNFAGTLEAGLLNFFGEDFKFNYHDFAIALKDVNIVELNFQGEGYDEQGRRLIEVVTSKLEKISGNLLIDKPNNKSGLVENPRYPIFNSTSNAFVYYDAPQVHGGIYKRDSIYFEIDPFAFHNLNNFEKEDMVFKGTFYSQNILAPIEDSLILRPDNSLGIVHQIPDEGFAVYQGKGRAYNIIDLSNQGIMVDGKITYNASTMTSRQMLLYPDSMVTNTDEFTIDKRISGIELPSVKGQKHLVKWLPHLDQLDAFQGDDPFVMLDNKATLAGNLTLKPTGLSGNGWLTLDDAQLSAQLYEFNAEDFKSPAVNLRLLNPATKELTLTTQNVKTFIDLHNQKGVFEKNDASLFADLTPLKYKSHMDRMEWDIAQGELTMLTPNTQANVRESGFYQRNMLPQDSTLKGSLFYSVKFGEDTLNFMSTKARYNTQTSLLKAENVHHVITADAKVLPLWQKVEVSPDERMRPLQKAVVYANNDSSFHRFYKAEITISGRKQYGGNGLYDYVDERDSIQTIHFQEIMVDSALNTFAKTKVSTADSFRLSPNFEYFGEIDIYAPNKYLTFNGFTKPVYECCGTKPEWFHFETPINPRHIMIPVEEKMRSHTMNFLTNGSVVREDTIRLYGGFCKQRYDYADRPFVSTSGYMTFNPKNRRFMIAEAYKLQNPDTLGNMVSLQKDYCYLFGEGLLKLPAKLGRVTLTNYGTSMHKLDDNTITLELVTKMNFLFDQQAIEMIANELVQNKSLRNVNLKRKTYRNALSQFVGASKAKDLLNRINLFGVLSETPDSMASTITFADLRLTWNPVSKSFISKGQLGIGSMGKVQVNKYVDGYLEISKVRSGDLFNLYIKIGADHYYGFVYTKNTLQIVSSNVDFLARLNSLSNRETRIRAKGDQPAYKYLVGTNRERNVVLTRYNQLMQQQTANTTSANDTTTSDTTNVQNIQQVETETISTDSTTTNSKTEINNQHVESESDRPNPQQNDDQKSNIDANTPKHDDETTDSQKDNTNTDNGSGQTT